MNGVGHKRVYLDIQSRAPSVAYPPRPQLGSVADLDILMEHCDFNTKKVMSLSFIVFVTQNDRFSTFAIVWRHVFLGLDSSNVLY